MSAQSFYIGEEGTTLPGFAQFMGLTEAERPGNDRYAEEFKVRKMPLLDHVVQFHL